MKRLFSLMIITVMAFGSLQLTSLELGAVDESYGAVSSLKTPSWIYIKKVTNRSLKIWWKRVDGASGYEVYKWNKKTKKYKKAKTIKSGKTTKWTNKKLPKNKTQSYKVRAYKKVNGKKVYSSFTYSVKARPYLKNSKKVNAGKVKVYSYWSGDRLKTLSMGLNSIRDPYPEVWPSKSNKDVIDDNVRWFSSNPSLVSVDKNGRFQSHGKAGKCTVVARAHNGVKATVKVVVSDFAHPSSFANTNRVSKEAAYVLKNQKKELCDITAYLERLKGEYMIGLSGADVVSYPNRDFGLTMDKKMEEFFKQNGAVIDAIEGNVFYLIPGEKNFSVSMIMYSEINYSSSTAEEYGLVKLAHCWYYAPLESANMMDDYMSLDLAKKISKRTKIK